MHGVDISCDQDLGDRCTKEFLCYDTTVLNVFSRRFKKQSHEHAGSITALLIYHQ